MTISLPLRQVLCVGRLFVFQGGRREPLPRLVSEGGMFTPLEEMAPLFAAGMKPIPFSANASFMSVFAFPLESGRLSNGVNCVECINKDREIMEKIEQAMTADDSEEGLYFWEGCEKEIK